MDLTVFIEALIIGILLFVSFPFAVFIDGLKLTKILLKIMPQKQPKGYEEFKKFVSSEQYKTHKIKWRKIYLLNVPIYAIVYIAISVITQNIMAGFFIGLFLTGFIIFGIEGNKEWKQRQAIRREFGVPSTY